MTLNKVPGGRPKNSGKYGEPTRTMRVPESAFEEVQGIIESKLKPRKKKKCPK